MEKSHDVKARERARAVWFVIFMAVVPTTLRLAIWTSSEITLRQVYGHERAAREHLRITRIKPRLVVSNGDVLQDRGFSHYLMAMALWLPLAVSLLVLILYTLLPKSHRTVWERKEQSVSPVGILWGLPLFFLATDLLPMSAALAISLASVVAALIWGRRIPVGTSML